jgi:hypothetical protein
VLNGTDKEDDRRFSLAHEVAHFILDYLQPRERAVHALGPTALDVLDGVRPATLQERVAGVLKGITLEVHVHLLGRSAAGDVDSFGVLDAEDRADRLALELLAPCDVVLRRLSANAVQWRDPSALDNAVTILQGDFGLPRGVAESYARFLVSNRRAPATFREWLGC